MNEVETRLREALLSSGPGDIPISSVIGEYERSTKPGRGYGRLWKILCRMRESQEIFLIFENGTNIGGIDFPDIVRINPCRSWRQDTAFAAGIEGSGRKKLEIIDEWLGKGQKRYPIPSRERMAGIFGNEKALEQYREQGEIGTWFGGKLPEGLISSWSPRDTDRTHVIFNIPGRPLLVVENLQTWHSIVQWNCRSMRYSAIIKGRGFEKAAIQAEARKICRKMHFPSVEYFGDLDMTGMFIPMNLEETMPIPLVPAVDLYILLINLGVKRKKEMKANVSRKSYRRLTAWMPGWFPMAAGIIQALWDNDEWIPQEALSLEILMSIK